MDMNTLERRTTESGRVYTDMESLFLPSVTTVLNEIPEPYGLKIWKQNNDGKGDNDDWRDILQYKANRGTLIHYNILKDFTDEEMFSENEETSTEELKIEGDWTRYEQDLQFAKEAWLEIIESRNIIPSNVLDVECFVTNTDVGYAGQFDMLYLDEDGNLVLSDLKTSKAVYDKHKLQLVAYEKALNLDIDLLEVIRIHPDSETWEISHDTDWVESRDELWSRFQSLRYGMDEVDEDFRKIVEDGIDDA